MSETDDQLADEAAERFAALQSGRARPADQRDFDLWRAQSPAHEAAAAEAEAIWHDIGGTPTARAFERSARSLPTRRWVLGGGLAAGLAGAVVVSGALGPAEGFAADYRTRRGERRRVTLPDGGFVWLNTQSAVSAAYDAKGRSARLLAGEAVFHAANDPARPLMIQAGPVSVRMAAGECRLYRAGARLEVSISEGAASVSAGGQTRTLAADQEIACVNGQFVGETTRVKASDLSAWTRGKLIFHNRPLADVVAELKRYQFGVIHVSDAQLARTEVSGVFDLDDRTAAIELLPRILPVKVVRMPMLTLVTPYP